MEQFGLREFIELTGIGSGQYGIYRISRDGVNVGDPDQSHQLAPKDELNILRAEDALRLDFPCSVEQFMEWYDATRGVQGENGEIADSDFPLASGFLKELIGTSESARTRLGPSVPSGKIVAAFKVKVVDSENRKWWDDRLRAVKKYGLKDARAALGGAKRPSQWYPLLVAAWLIEKKYLPPAIVLRAVEKHFPDVNTTLL
jgi:hypothetical protein